MSLQNIVYFNDMTLTDNWLDFLIEKGIVEVCIIGHRPYADLNWLQLDFVSTISEALKDFLSW